MSQHVRSANVLVKRDREALAGTTRNALGRVVVPKVGGSSPLGHPPSPPQLRPHLPPDGRAVPPVQHHFDSHSPYVEGRRCHPWSRRGAGLSHRRASACQVGVAQVCTQLELRALRSDPTEVDRCQDAALQICATKVGTLQPGAPQVDVFEVRSGQARTSKVRPGKVQDIVPLPFVRSSHSGDRHSTVMAA
jgi:hypothetical protein